MVPTLWTTKAPSTYPLSSEQSLIELPRGSVYDYLVLGTLGPRKDALEYFQFVGV
ncbi:hypothetical protein FA13DRAFT_1740135 [Coprinellus micaceus]|uniref:Uncharacterized protein n=1 Tax=Coprinellus micaceus TaxID=71717 RepID=A0A4Y7SQ62_COPMI|nr:hypothetical protein FA13DRAFT_1740135 [Coprinellus micaceus]